MKWTKKKDKIEDQKKWLLEMISYLLYLKDTNGNCSIKQKKPVRTFCVIRSILVCSHKMLPDQLEMLFSRIRQRGECDNYSLQFKYDFRAIMKKNSEKANVSIEEPMPSASEPQISPKIVLNSMSGYIARHVKTVNVLVLLLAV